MTAAAVSLSLGPQGTVNGILPKPGEDRRSLADEESARVKSRQGRGQRVAKARADNRLENTRDTQEVLARGVQRLQLPLIHPGVERDAEGGRQETERVLSPRDTEGVRTAGVQVDGRAAGAADVGVVPGLIIDDNRHSGDLQEVDGEAAITRNLDIHQAGGREGPGALAAECDVDLVQR